MRTPDDVRRLVDEVPKLSAINDDEDIDKVDAPGEGDEPPTISPTIEDGDEAVGPEQEAARASARRAAFQGEAQFTALRRVRRQWPNLKNAEAIVAEAYSGTTSGGPAAGSRSTTSSRSCRAWRS